MKEGFAHILRPGIGQSVFFKKNGTDAGKTKFREELI
jgi:hypothetical protein